MSSPANYIYITTRCFTIGYTYVVEMIAQNLTQNISYIYSYRLYVFSCIKFLIFFHLIDPLSRHVGRVFISVYILLWSSVLIRRVSLFWNINPGTESRLDSSPIYIPTFNSCYTTHINFIMHFVKQVNPFDSSSDLSFFLWRIFIFYSKL